MVLYILYVLRMFALCIHALYAPTQDAGNKEITHHDKTSQPLQEALRLSLSRTSQSQPMLPVLGAPQYGNEYPGLLEHYVSHNYMAHSASSALPGFWPLCQPDALSLMHQGQQCFLCVPWAISISQKEILK